MFTGIIEEIGRVAAVEQMGDSMRITVAAEAVLSDAKLGDSIAVNGVCLTVAERTASTFSADCMAETLARSSLGKVQVGGHVNLERAAALNSRLGGHIVQGHVDSTAELLQLEHTPHWDVLRFSLPERLARYVVEKGSITVDGTSLTVSNLGSDYFEVSLIPTTLRDTTLGELRAGQTVNLEVDVVAKYVERMLGSRVERGGAEQAPGVQ
ncbi:riboflavin synthase [Corynebacterium canis]|uniref:Riboflavin synthase n=1 Tax=Corynebacterium canis TaxID=679663 RepID=A0A5C5UF27_9CORY|nr:riboflavin synthase [Corynebacterium canis]TWT24005.1 riboflavin synthase [Corynebacterium canis]WJY75366.1 Riboflavin synthase [Corynebacterium canis]